MMKDRIKEIRKSLGLTQQEFADKTGLKRNSVANYEIGRNNPIDPVIKSICREFGVNEMWLRTGEGEMFATLDPEDEYIINISKIDMTDNKFVQGMIRAIANSSPDQLKEVENFMRVCLGIPKEEG